ncbi:hypothetical protein ACFTXO_18065 [Streptomyces sp. NPDC057067]|uniref:hypothetical protein n=1 Tax=Streptomyces TaxID=1883 RepID=UPI0019212E01|nr:hypothetical protein [Streptomyces silvae]MBL1288116.1 hypothetical protein [Streptomyces silvae]
MLLDQADEHLAAARIEQAREQAAAEVAATADEHLRVLGAADGKSRFALRMAGTSRKEHTQLTKQAEADRAAAWREGADARVAARQAAADAWKVLRDSPHVRVLGAAERQALDAPDLQQHRVARTERGVEQCPEAVELGLGRHPAGAEWWEGRAGLREHRLHRRPQGHTGLPPGRSGAWCQESGCASVWSLHAAPEQPSGRGGKRCPFTSVLQWWPAPQSHS